MRRIWPFRHFGLKLLSLGVAVLLWMTVSGEETVERVLRVPLELQQFPAGLEIQGEAPSTVDVRVRGMSGGLSRVGAGDIVAVLDLRGARAGSRLFPVTPEQVRVPYGVEIVQVTPSTVALTLEHSATREVPVLISVGGVPAPGYVVGMKSVSPERVEIVGPESAVKRVTEALTETISIAGARAPVREEATVGLGDPALRLKTPRTVTVIVQIVPGPLERTVRNRPIQLRNLGPHLSARALPDAVDVGLRGSREALVRLDPADVSAYIDLSGLGAGQYPLAVQAAASTLAGVTRIDPMTVQVRITSAKN